MAHAQSTGGYTVDDLDWLRAELGIAHLELDPWGSLIVSPATDPHETAHDFATGQVTTASGAIDLDVAGRPLRFDLTRTAI
jgi:hypothetical protein